MKHNRQKLSSLVAVVSVFTVALAPNVALAVNSNQENGKNTSMYSADLRTLNDSGVSGYANLHFFPGQSGDTDQLAVNLYADGTTPGQTHPVHIHGRDNPEVALCPTNTQDTNGDGFVSVIEGAGSYGPIKLNLTSPQTPFGTPPTPALFTPFAGTADPANFPLADQDGNIHLTETYHFDQSPAARGALASLTPLENQHIVVHGANAPASVDADAFAALGAPVTGDTDAVIYDVLLPVACGEIRQNGSQNNDNQGDAQQGGNHDVSDQNQAAVDAFQAHVAVLRANFDTARQTAQQQYDQDRQNNAGVARDHYIATIQSSRDQYVNQFSEARNQFVDQMNKNGQTELRDQTTSQAEGELQDFSSAFETAKNEFAATH